MALYRYIFTITALVNYALIRAYLLHGSLNNQLLIAVFTYNVFREALIFRPLQCEDERDEWCGVLELENSKSP